MNTATPRLRTATSQFTRSLSTQTTASNRLNQTYTLPDGRQLGYAEYGDANGKPLLYFHGFPSSRIEAKPMHDYASRHGIRVISLERPGWGLSSPKPQRTMLDWSADVKDFATGMKLDRFTILGTSGGGPFAVACAYGLPRNMLANVGLFASGPPWVAGRRYMTYTRRLTSVMAHNWPSSLKLVLDVVLGLMRWALSTGFATRRIDTWLEAVNKKEAEKRKEAGKPAKEEQTIEEQRKYLVDLLIGEPFVQGTGTMVHEAKLLSASDWGFPLEDVTYPVKIWHGAKDRNAPIEAIRYLAEKMPNSTLHEFKDDTHYTMGDHVDFVVREVMAVEEPAGN